MELLIGNMVQNFVGFFGEQLFFEPQSYVLCVHVHPGKLTWNPKMKVWKMIFVFKQVIFTFHVHFPGCIYFCICFLLHLCISQRPFEKDSVHRSPYQDLSLGGLICFNGQYYLDVPGS